MKKMSLNVFVVTDTISSAGNTYDQCNGKLGNEAFNAQGQNNLFLDINSFWFEHLYILMLRRI